MSSLDTHRTSPHPRPGRTTGGIEENPKRAPTDALSAWTSSRRDPYYWAGFLFIGYAVLSVCRFRRMATMSWDLGIFEQAIRGYAHLQAPMVDLKGPGTNILGDHFSPIIAVIAPFYRVFPTPVTLLMAQALLFAVAAVPITRVAAHLLGRRQGLAIGLAYGLAWGVQRAVDFDFHAIAFAMPLLAFSLEALLRKRFRTALCWALPLVLVKEDLGATVAAIGLIVLLRARRTEPRMKPYALATIGFGLTATVLTVALVIPAFNTARGYDYWNKIGETTGQAAQSIPPDTALRTLLWILLPTTGLLALRSPLLLAALPTIGWRLLSNNDHYWGLDWHYNAVLMPVVILALVDAIVTTRRTSRAWLHSYATHLPTAVAATALALSTNLPLADLTHAVTHRVDSRTRAVEQLLEQIPDGAGVEANIGPISRLTNRCRVFWIGDTRGIDPDYIAIDNTSGWAGDPLSYARQLHPAATYTELGTAGGYTVLRRA